MKYGKIEDAFDDDNVPNTTDEEERENVRALIGKKIANAVFDRNTYILEFEDGVVLTFTHKGIVWGEVKHSIQ